MRKLRRCPSRYKASTNTCVGCVTDAHCSPALPKCADVTNTCVVSGCPVNQRYDAGACTSCTDGSFLRVATNTCAAADGATATFEGSVSLTLTAATDAELEAAKAPIERKVEADIMAENPAKILNVKATGKFVAARGRQLAASKKLNVTFIVTMLESDKAAVFNEYKATVNDPARKRALMNKIQASVRTVGGITGAEVAVSVPTCTGAGCPAVTKPATTNTERSRQAMIAFSLLLSALF